MLRDCLIVGSSVNWVKIITCSPVKLTIGIKLITLLCTQSLFTVVIVGKTCFTEAIPVVPAIYTYTHTNNQPLKSGHLSKENIFNGVHSKVFLLNWNRC